MKLVLIYLILLLSLPGQAFVSSGTPTELYPAIVQTDSGCTATVVGLNPPTLITARHCVDKAQIRPVPCPSCDPNHWASVGRVSPAKIIMPQSVDPASVLTPDGLKVYPGLDVAFLIFDQATRNTLFADVSDADVFWLNTKGVKWGEELTLCGYGSNSVISSGVGFGIKRIGTNRAIIQNPAFNFWDLLKKYANVNSMDEVAKEDQAATFHGGLQSLIPAYWVDREAFLGVSILRANSFSLPITGDGWMEPEATRNLLNHGDSGSPAFIFDPAAGRNVIMAVTATETHDLQSREIWFNTLFRVDRPWFQIFLQKDVLPEGADLKFR